LSADALFQPYEFKGLKLPNRVVMAPMTRSQSPGGVATEEVAAVLTACAGVTEAVVYGVAVPGTEGRAGMAALTVDAGFDLAALHRHVAENLPEYARPLFLRVGENIASTATFKPAKALLAREGFALDRVADALYFDDRAKAAFVPLDAALHERLRSGQMRL